MHTQNNPGRAAAVYVLDINGRLLLTQRGPNARHESFTWEGTGGKVEEGESFEEAVRREAMEEVGLELNDLTEITEELIVDAHGQYFITKVYITTSNSVPKIDGSGACIGFGWFTVDEIEKLNTASYTAKDVTALKKHL